MAATSRAFARRRSPISARSRSACRWWEQHCWWRCRHRRLDRYPEQARLARDHVLERMVEDGRISSEDAAAAKAVPVPRMRKSIPMLAPHSADRAVMNFKVEPV